MLDWVMGVMEKLGPLGVGLLMLLENVFPPIPSEIIMPLAGYSAARGGMNFWAAVIVGSIGSFLGTVGWYVLGRRVSEKRLRQWVDRHGVWLTLDCDDLDRARDYFQRRGGITVFLMRLVPGLRTWISVPAGLERMGTVPFLAYTFAGTFLWTALLAWAGRLLGDQYHRIDKYLDPFFWAAMATIVALYIWRVFRGHGRRQQDCREE